MMRYSFRYILREGISSIWQHGFMSFATVGVLVACLIIMSSFALVSLNINEAIKDIEEQNEIVVFIEETSTREDIARINQELLGIPNVGSVEYIDKENAFSSFKEELGTRSELLQGIENPLRDSFSIRVYELEQFETTLMAVSNVEGIAKVNSSREITDTLMNLRNAMTAIALALIIILGGVTVFIVSNTIRLAAFNRREEIAIMKMVGATNAFIRGSFMVEGILLGLAGGAIAFFAEWGIYHSLIEKALSGTNLIPVVPFSGIMQYLIIAFAAISLLEGIIGSFVSLRKFINV